MIESRDILLGVVLPAVIAAIILAAAWRMSWATPAAVGAAFIAGYFALLRPAFPPLDAIDWLCFAAPIIVVAAILDNIFPAARSMARHVAGVVLCTLVTWLLLHPLLESSWQGWSGWLWIGGIALLMTIWWGLIDRLGKREPGILPFAMFIASASGAACTAMSGSQKLGQIGGILCAASAALLVCGFFFKQVRMQRGGILVMGILFVALIACASDRAYAELPAVIALLLLISPLMAWITQSVIVRRRGRVLRTVIGIGAVLIPAAAATTFTFNAFRHAMAQSNEFGWE